MKKITPLQLILFIVSGLLGILFIIMAVSSVQYIVEYCASYGMKFTDMFGEGMKYIIGQSLSYLVYAGLFLVLGLFAGKIEAIKTILNDAMTEEWVIDDCLCEGNCGGTCEEKAEETVAVEEPVCEAKDEE